MAAAYSALVSLMNTMDQIQIHPLLSTSFNNYPNESLREKIDMFLDFVEKFSDADSCGEAQDLVRRIAVVAHEAEDIIEIHASGAVKSHVVSSSQQSQTFLSSLQGIIDDMDSIKEHIIKIQEQTGYWQPTSSMPPASSSSAPPAIAMVESSSEAEDLVRPMAVVALEADEAIQVQPADPVCDEQILLPDMQNTKEDMDSIKNSTGSINQQPTSASAKTTNMVGFDRYLEQLLDQLTGQPSRRQILPIVGMGGIGKTTLARNVYDNLLIVEHFYVRAWVTVSQEFSVSEILLQALSCLGRSTSKTDRTDGQLGEDLHKILYGRRYLIVLDDVWSVEAWEKIKFFLPENNNGSRIVITTRQSELVGYFGSSSLAVDFLDDKKSWELFCEKTFPQQGCPPELVEIGKRIVVKCKGLPLAIVVVGGFLGKSPRTQEYWEEIEKDKNLIPDSGEGNNVSGILYLSYKHIPVCLKSCFLYFGLFPEDHRIKVSQLIRFWVAEGFIKSNTNQSLEEVAESYVNELVDRNLVLIGDLRSNKKPKTCSVHDLVRDLCLSIAEKENVYSVQRDIDGKRHFIVDKRTARFYDPESLTRETPSLVHPLIFDGQRLSRFSSRLLRVLFSDGRIQDPFREVNLRLLMESVEHSIYLYEIPPSISLLWSLQTLIVTRRISVTAPYEIWVMPQLRHILISWSVRLPHPPPSDEVFVLQNLQTLEIVKNLIVTEEVCKRIPNIKKLCITYYASSSSYHLHNVGRFSKLESLQCSYYGNEDVGDLFWNLKLPSSLKKLSLKGCKLVWSDMGMIASLPHLQFLKLIDDAVVGEEWNCIARKFLCLKHLEIIDCDDLTYWIADSSNFPMLEKLSLENLSKLEEIPSDIGEVPTLEKIYMHECSKSANFSAVKMLEEQVENLGNLGLHLHIAFYYASEAEKLREEIKELDIACQNLRISSLLSK